MTGISSLGRAANTSSFSGLLVTKDDSTMMPFYLISPSATIALLKHNRWITGKTMQIPNPPPERTESTKTVFVNMTLFHSSLCYSELLLLLLTSWLYAVRWWRPPCGSKGWWSWTSWCPRWCGLHSDSADALESAQMETGPHTSTLQTKHLSEKSNYFTLYYISIYL